MPTGSPGASQRLAPHRGTSLSNSVISQQPFSGVESPQIPREDSHMRLDGQVGNLNVAMGTIDQQSAAVIDANPAFSAWWERWREATTTRFPVASIRRTDEYPES